MEDIHSERYVKGLFNEMSQTYGIVNILSSLGFAYLWRKQAVQSIPSQCSRICDLMTGGAECLSHIKNRFGSKCEVHLVDWCENMCKRADSTVKRHSHGNCTVINSSALSLPAEDQRYDAVVSTFGLKTLAPKEIEELAKEIKRVLKPGGSVSMLEFSMPQNRFILFFFRIYVKIYVPLLGWAFLGNPDNYRMLWRYTKEFQSCERALKAFRKEGFEIDLKSRFFGSATQIVGYAQQDARYNSGSCAASIVST
jgi:demethylmenaquinone methyltransferase / 2-methoxy-6-polyprenyl-1,4-benzoquinol methylase